MKVRYLFLFSFAVALLFVIDGCEHKPKELIHPGTNDTTFIPPKPAPTKCSPDTVYFQNTILPLLVSNCNGVGCHNSTDRKEGVVLDNYKDIMKIVKAGNPNSSKLYQKIIDPSPGDVMPPSGKMPQATIDLIKKWILQGAKNNYCNDGCDSTKFAYAANISKIINDNCMGCHSTGSTKIGTYAELKVQADNSKLWNAINHYSGALPMPTSALKISDCDIKKIQKWLAAGAPNN